MRLKYWNDDSPETQRLLGLIDHYRSRFDALSAMVSGYDANGWKATLEDEIRSAVDDLQELDPRAPGNWGIAKETMTFLLLLEHVEPDTAERFGLTQLVRRAVTEVDTAFDGRSLVNPGALFRPEDPRDEAEAPYAKDLIAERIDLLIQADRPAHEPTATVSATGGDDPGPRKLFADVRAVIEHWWSWPGRLPDAVWAEPPQVRDNGRPESNTPMEQARAWILRASRPGDLDPRTAHLSSRGRFVVGNDGTGRWHAYHAESGLLLSARNGFAAGEPARAFVEALEEATTPAGQPFDWSNTHLADRLGLPDQTTLGRLSATAAAPRPQRAPTVIGLQAARWRPDRHGGELAVLADAVPAPALEDPQLVTRHRVAFTGNTATYAEVTAGKTVQVSQVAAFAHRDVPPRQAVELVDDPQIAPVLARFYTEDTAFIQGETGRGTPMAITGAWARQLLNLDSLPMHLRSGRNPALQGIPDPDRATATGPAAPMFEVVAEGFGDLTPTRSGPGTRGRPAR